MTTTNKTRPDPLTTGSAATQDAAAAELDQPPEPIPALWFTAEGCGPDAVDLELRPYAAEPDDDIPASLGLYARSAGELIVFAGPLIDGGFNLDRAAAAELHRQLGAWLEVNRG